MTSQSVWAATRESSATMTAQSTTSANEEGGSHDKDTHTDSKTDEVLCQAAGSGEGELDSRHSSSPDNSATPRS